jgi:hypothetical protein
MREMRQTRKGTKAMPLAYIKFVDSHGHPVDPGFGNEGGEGPTDPGYDLGLGLRPGNDLPWAPVRPGNLPIDPAKPWPPLPWEPGSNFPPTPTDPSWGVGSRPAPGQPIYIPPSQIDNELPPVAGTKPPANPPPGTIWPPIAGLPPGKVALLAWFLRLGWRYVVVDASLAPGTPLPPEGGGGTTPPAGGTTPDHPPTTEAGFITKAMGATTMDSTVSLGVSSTTAAIGTVLQIDSEYMTVSNVADPQNLKVARATYGSTITAHAVNSYVSFLVNKPV